MPVELHHAFLWDCDACGRENVFRAVTGDVDLVASEADEDRVTGLLVAPGALESDSDPAPDAVDSEVLTQRVLLAPRFVRCRHCGASFGADVPCDD